MPPLPHHWGPCFSLWVPSRPTCPGVPGLLNEDPDLGLSAGAVTTPWPLLWLNGYCGVRTESQTPSPTGALSWPDPCSPPRCSPHSPSAPRLPGLLEQPSAGQGRCLCVSTHPCFPELGTGARSSSGSQPLLCVFISLCLTRNCIADGDKATQRKSDVPELAVTGEPVHPSRHLPTC